MGRGWWEFDRDEMDMNGRGKNVKNQVLFMKAMATPSKTQRLRPMPTKPHLDHL
jgi:hypothetical protein